MAASLRKFLLDFLNSQNIFPASLLECHQFNIEMSPDWTLCVCVYGSRHGDVLEGTHSVKTSYQQYFCIRLEQITNGFEGLVPLGGPPAWKDLGAHKTGSFF